MISLVISGGHVYLCPWPPTIVNWHRTLLHHANRVCHKNFSGSIRWIGYWWRQKAPHLSGVTKPVNYGDPREEPVLIWTRLAWWSRVRCQFTMVGGHRHRYTCPLNQYWIELKFSISGTNDGSALTEASIEEGMWRTDWLATRLEGMLSRGEHSLESPLGIANS